MKSKSHTRNWNSTVITEKTHKRQLPSMKYISIAMMASISGLAQAATEINANNSFQSFNSDSDYVVNDKIDTEKSKYTQSSANSDTAFTADSGVYQANQGLANSVFITTMHDRSGENRQSGDEDAPAAWANLNTGRSNSKAGGGAVSLGSNTNVLRVGSDLFRHDFGNQRVTSGVMLGYADARTASDAKHASGRATGNLRGYNVGVYGTWYGGAVEQKSGPYIDSWLQYGTFHNAVMGSDLAAQKYRAHNWSSSLEVGYDMPVSGFKSLTLQPQFQTIYTRYTQNDHQDVNGMRIRSKEVDGLITRIGARLYGDLGDVWKTQPFVEVNWWHAGNSNTGQNDTASVDQVAPANRYEVKVGAQTRVSNNWLLWINAGVQSGKSDYARVEGVVGGRYSW